MRQAIVAALAMLGLVGSAAEAEQLCPGQAVPAIDGRLLGHLQYGEARADELVAAPAGFAIGAACRVRREVAADLARMLAAAEGQPGLKGRVRAISCYRTIAHQRRVFCSQIGKGRRSRDAADRARWVGPPGFSEHATGYAIDFGTRPSPGCGDVSACFARTPAGRWLLQHAPEYGFELSFPQGNAQGVSWEPWHWRWVGASAQVPGAAAARTLFARARLSYPALPSTPDSGLRVLMPPAMTGIGTPPPPGPPLRLRP